MLFREWSGETTSFNCLAVVVGRISIVSIIFAAWSNISIVFLFRWVAFGNIMEIFSILQWTSKHLRRMKICFLYKLGKKDDGIYSFHCEVLSEISLNNFKSPNDENSTMILLEPWDKKEKKTFTMYNFIWNSASNFNDFQSLKLL